MPTFITRGTMSAQAFGFGSSPGETSYPYWLAYINHLFNETVAATNPSTDLIVSDRTTGVTTNTLKINSGDATILWQNSIGLADTPYTTVLNFGVDSSGNTYVPYYKNPMSNPYFGITKLDNLGSSVWQNGSQVVPGSVAFSPSGVSITSSGNLLYSLSTNSSGSYPFGWAVISSGGSVSSQSYYEITGKSSTFSPRSMSTNGLNDFAQMVNYDIPADNTANLMIVSFDESGTINWAKKLFDETYPASIKPSGCAVDSAGSVYAWYADAAFTYHLIKFTSGGSIAWGKTIPYPVVDVVTDSSNNLYIVDIYGDIFCFQSDGTFVYENWLHDADYFWAPVAVTLNNTDGVLYIVGNIESGSVTAKVPLSGTGIGGGPWTVNGYSFVYEPYTDVVPVESPSVTDVSFDSISRDFSVSSDTETVNLTSYTSIVTPI